MCSYYCQSFFGNATEVSYQSETLHRIPHVLRPDELQALENVWDKWKIIFPFLNATALDEQVLAHGHPFSVFTDEADISVLRGFLRPDKWQCQHPDAAKLQMDSGFSSDLVSLNLKKTCPSALSIEWCIDDQNDKRELWGSHSLLCRNHNSPSGNKKVLPVTAMKTRFVVNVVWRNLVAGLALHASINSFQRCPTSKISRLQRWIGLIRGVLMSV